ncbi:MAG: PAS domain-containing sensor histidine kinase [Desulfomonilaceae bacterium]|nr:PAS domain-containing sensor histidine kinase [Desulfomonilaceae bacterium]
MQEDIRTTDQTFQDLEERLAELTASNNQLRRELDEMIRAKELLKESEARYRFLVEHMHDILWTADLEMKAVYVSPSIIRVLGFSPEERMNHKAEESLTRKSFEAARSTLERELRYDTEDGVHLDRTVTMDLEFLRKDGTVACLETAMSFIRDEHSKPIGVYGLSRDVTDRKQAQEMLEKSLDELELRVAERTAELVNANAKLHEEIAVRRAAEEALRESEKRYRSLFEDSPISLWEEDFSAVKAYLDDLRDSGVEDFVEYFSHNPDALKTCAERVEILDVNESTLSFYGAESKDVFSQGLGIVFCEESYETLKDQCAAIGQGKTRFEAESVNKTFLDEKKDVYVKWSVVPGHEERYSKVLVSVADITDLKLTQKKLADALSIAVMLRAEAEAANQAKSEFLATMSHEFRTPLNAIIGFSEILEDRECGELNEAQLKYVGHVANSGRHLLHLVNDILDLAKVESGRMELQPVPVDPDRLIRSGLLMIREKALKRNLKIDLQIDQALQGETIYVDEIKLKQVLFNLLSNAAKFTPEGGRIGVEVSKVWENLVVRVSDTGIGIDPKDCERIFGLFEQIDSSLTRKQDGTGLGLALTRRLVELHGGRIWAYSDGIGKGSIFTFTIPLRVP